MAETLSNKYCRSAIFSCKFNLTIGAEGQCLL